MGLVAEIAFDWHHAARAKCGHDFLGMFAGFSMEVANQPGDHPLSRFFGKANRVATEALDKHVQSERAAVGKARLWERSFGPDHHVLGRELARRPGKPGIARDERMHACREFAKRPRKAHRNKRFAGAGKEM